MRFILPPALKPSRLCRAGVWLTVFVGVFLLVRELASWPAAVFVTLSFGLVCRVIVLCVSRPVAGNRLSAVDQGERRWWFTWFWVMLAGGPAVVLMAEKMDPASAPIGFQHLWPRSLDLDVAGFAILALSALGAAVSLVRAQVHGQSRAEFVLLVLFCSVALCFAQGLALMLWQFEWIF